MTLSERSVQSIDVFRNTRKNFTASHFFVVVIILLIIVRNLYQTLLHINDKQCIFVT